jgi:hypothetical protein
MAPLFGSPRTTEPRPRASSPYRVPGRPEIAPVPAYEPVRVRVLIVLVFSVIAAGYAFARDVASHEIPASR